MFMLAGVPRDPDLEPVWNGSMKGIYLAALRDIPAFVARQPDPEPERWELPPEGKVIEALRRAGKPLGVSTLASLTHDSGGDIRRAVDSLMSSGVLQVAQPTLFDLWKRGERYRVVGKGA